MREESSKWAFTVTTQSSKPDVAGSPPAANDPRALNTSQTNASVGSIEFDAI